MNVIYKLELEEDLVIKTESSDLSEFIEQCHEEDISNEILTESKFIEPDEEMMNPVTITFGSQLIVWILIDFILYRKILLSFRPGS